MFIGIDIGGTKCAITLGDENGRVIKKERFFKRSFFITKGGEIS